MASGVQANKRCLEAFQELKSKKSKFIIFGLNDTNTEVDVIQKSELASVKRDNEEVYTEFVSHFKMDQCRYAVFDFEYEKEGGKRRKICFFSWTPDSSPIKQKMLYASSKDALRRALDTFPVEIQGTDHDEISYETVLEKASKGH